MARFASLVKVLLCASTSGALGVEHLVSEAQFNGFIDGGVTGRVLVISFDSPACGASCEVMHRQVARVSQSFPDTVDFAVVDAENAFEVAMVAGIEMVPTIQFYLNGLQVGRLEGPEEAEKLQQSLEKFVELARSSQRPIKESLPQDASSRSSALKWLQRWLSDSPAHLGGTTLALPAPPQLPAPSTPLRHSSTPAAPRPKAQPAAAAASKGQVLALELAQSGAQRAQAVAYLQAQAREHARADAKAHAQAQVQAQMYALGQARAMPAPQAALHQQQAQLHYPAMPQVHTHPYLHAPHAQVQHPGLPTPHAQAQMYMSR